MKIIQGTIIIIGVFMLFSACASPTSTTPPTATPPPLTAGPPITEPPPTTPTTPPTTPPITALPPTPPAVQGQYDIWIPGREFKPSILTVPAGTKVTWTNKDGEQHTVTSATGLFDGSISFGQSYSYIFNAPGTYEYFCNPHPDMTAKVIVVP